MGALRIFGLTVFGIMLGLGVLGEPTVVAAAANLSHSYKSNSTITSGSLVSVDAKQSGYVVTANKQNSKHLVGVAVTSNDSLLAINVTTGDVQVAISGIANALVSTLNGPIKTGDQIAVSPINGVGMEAAPDEEVIGIAQAAFNAQSSGAKMQQVTDKNGKKTEIAVGYMPLTIAIGVAPSSVTGGKSNVVQRLANYVAGRQVSTTSVVISAIIAFVAIISVVTLVYGTIRGSMISIGRNPLAKSAIFESLAQVIGMATLIVVVAVVIIYLILR